jgi:hypothetical protein
MPIPGRFAEPQAIRGRNQPSSARFAIPTSIEQGKKPVNFKQIFGSVSSPDRGALPISSQLHGDVPFFGWLNFGQPSRHSTWLFVPFLMAAYQSFSIRSVLTPIQRELRERTEGYLYRE